MDDKGDMLFISVVAIEQNTDLNLIESGASDNSKVRIFSFSKWRLVKKMKVRKVEKITFISCIVTL